MNTTPRSNFDAGGFASFVVFGSTSSFFALLDRMVLRYVSSKKNTGMYVRTMMIAKVYCDHFQPLSCVTNPPTTGPSAGPGDPC